MQKEIFRLYEEISDQETQNEEAVMALHNFITVVLERIELHNEYRSIVFGINPSPPILLKYLDSLSHL
jgi:hypothetical protein